MTTRRFYLYAAAVVVLALLVREWFVLAAVIPNPNQGDVGAYLRYAQHLVWDGVFTQAGNGQAVIPDAYRSPGYPWLLAAVFRFTGMEGWYPVVYQAQVLLGAATVAGVIALARQWLSRPWALAAGVWMALQPHHIAATGALLTEVLFGACIVAALLCATLALRRRSMPLAVLAGAVFGLGYLVNPVIALFPVALLLVYRGALRYGVTVLLVSLLAVGGWSARNAATHAAGDARAVENFVQGSWPGYHHAMKWWPWFPADRAVKAGIEGEMATMKADRGEGLRTVATRLATDPVRYARWYMIEKPFLLWDWDIRMGKGGFYQIGVQDSPLDHGPLLPAVILQWALNPLAFVLALFGIALARRGPPAFQMAALFAVYITAVHVVFQAEPRYSIPYRSVEIPLSITAASHALSWLAVRKRRGRREVCRAVSGHALGDS